MQNGVDDGDFSIVRDDRYCVGCGYNVRTLKWSAKCPECGRSVWDAVRRPLWVADRKWLRSLELGLWFLALSVVLSGAAMILTRGQNSWLVAPYFLIPVGSKLPLERVGFFAHDEAARWVFLASVAAQGIGFLYLTKKEKSENTDERRERVTLKGASVLMLLGLLWIGIGSRRSADTEGIGWFAFDFLLIFLSLKRLSNLAEMGEQRTLALWTNWVRLCQIACQFLLLAGLAERQTMCFWLVGIYCIAATDLIAVVLWLGYLRMVRVAGVQAGLIISPKPQLKNL